MGKLYSDEKILVTNNELGYHVFIGEEVDKAFYFENCVINELTGIPPKDFHRTIRLNFEPVMKSLEENVLDVKDLEIALLQAKVSKLESQ